MFTKGEVIKEYFRLVDIVNEAEQERTFAWADEDGEEQTESFSLLDADEAQRMREEYSDRAEVVLSHLRREERRGAPVEAS